MMRNWKPRGGSIRDLRGMSLLEVTLATLLITITFVGVARLLTVGISSTNKSRMQTSTVTLAQQGIEAIQALPFSSIATPASPEYCDSLGNSSDPATGTAYSSSDSRVMFVRTTTVTNLDAKEKEITVTVQSVRAAYGSSLDITTFTTRRVKF